MATAPPRWGRATSFAVVVLCYLLAAAAALGAALLVGTDRPLAGTVVGYAVAMLVVFGFSVGVRNGSMFDAYWSVLPPLAAVYLTATADPGADGVRQALVLAVVWLWGIRLTVNWARGWPGIEHEDWRYVDMYAKSPLPRTLTGFLGVHLFPTVMITLGSLPLYPALTTGTRDVGALDLVALVVGLAAVVLELVADEQMRAFGRTKQAGEVMDRGLWRWSRHPNYFGEILFWWSLFLFGLAADPSWWWTGVGAVGMVLMFLFASIPMLDDRSRARRPEFDAYARRTSALVPWPPRRG